MNDKQKRARRKALALLTAIAMINLSVGIVIGVLICSVSATEDISPTEILVPEVSAAPIVETKPALPVIQTEGRTLAPELAETMAIMSQKYGIPLALAVAMAEQESRFNPDAVSSTNDYGIMQINKINHGWLRQRGIDPMTHTGNIEAGCLMISEAVRKYADYNLALMAYNCGDGGANKLWKQGIYSTAYSRSVMARYEKWSAYLGGK